MKVILSVGGRFHAFNLAQQLLPHGALERLITSYPGFEVMKYGIPLEKVRSHPIKELIYRGWAHLPHALSQWYNPQNLTCELYDRLARRDVVDCDIFVGWSSFCLHSLREAKKKGAITIVERGSTHMLHQTEILTEESERFGVKPEVAHPAIIRKELLEYEEADYISIPSQFVKRTFLERGVAEEKLICVPYGVDLTDFRQIPKEDGVFRVIFSGYSCLRKGVHYLLEAFSGLNLPNSELILIGGGGDEIKPFLKRYQGKYRWIGHKNQNELYRYYSQGSVFVLPSIEEGLAMVQMQAMACGLPLICTPNTGGEDLIEDGKEGFIVPVRDVEAIREKLEFLYENPAILREMGRKAKEKAILNFSWDRFGVEMLEQYNRILKLDIT